ncbi:putative secreted protein [Kutzneria albida DSM 43870]|uniref:Putative secreted protein n=1 Tax=Kutzneria albida DSM 43870 TaxID=1449976 RepID=W5W860_9PSEU|nr:putative secreted protein [Kutzneria albida DSM 43870]
MFQQSRFRGNRTLVAAILCVLLTAVAGCTGSSVPPPAGNPAPPAEPGFVLSYAAAAARLDGLDPATAEGQLRDWARTGLASYLEMDAARLRDATYDSLPVRDPGLSDLSRQPTGPGRALYDGKGVLHLLVPRGDPHRARTIGLLVDQYSADAGDDPPQVQVHDYELLTSQRAVSVSLGKAVATPEVRAANGYVAQRVDEAGGLTGFLAKTRHLTGLSLRGNEVWAEGWNWPDVPAAPLSAEDVTVIQRGYTATSGPSPGFSLDPGPVKTAADVLALVPGLSPSVAEAVAARSDTPALSQLRQEVLDALFGGTPPPAGLPADRTRLWALKQLLDGQPGYSQARYDGPLAGTEVGMTLYYGDYIAKQWSTGVGGGVPDKAVPGFVADPDATIPWGHCPEGSEPTSESGRLWFGQNESGFAYTANRVTIGAQATRLFAKSNGDAGEVEPSYAFGRGLGWWDQHYDAVASYEPQFERIDQIMRWSGALEWLVTKAGKRLPDSGGTAGPGLKFADWYAKHTELRERSAIDFVSPPSAGDREAVLSKPSKTFEECGFTAINGGVSLGNLLTRQGTRDHHPDLPSSVGRAGVYDQGSAYDPATGTGHLKQVSLDDAGKAESYRQYTFSAPAQGGAAVETTASGRKVGSLGGVKVNLDAGTPRQVRNDTSADRGHITQRVEVQGKELGALDVRKDHDSVTLAWQSSVVDNALRLLNAEQSRPGVEPGSGAVLSHQDASGQVQYQLGGIDGPWLETTPGAKPPGSELTFRLGAPRQQGGTAEFSQATLRGPPDLGGPDQWLRVSLATKDQPARISPAGAPDKNARQISVTTPDGHGFTVYREDDHWAVQHKDLAGKPENAAALAKFEVIDAAMQQAAKAKDGYYRALALDGNGVALVGADRVVLVSNFEPWAPIALHAIVPGEAAPLFQIQGKSILHVGQTKVSTEPGGQVKHEKLGEALGQDRDVYLLESARVAYSLREGSIMADEVSRDAQVVVVPAVAEQTAKAVDLHPDLREYAGKRWQLVRAGGSGGSGPPLRGTTGTVGRVSTSTVQTTSPSPTTSAAAGQTTGVVPILLVCPENTPDVPECKQ